MLVAEVRLTNVRARSALRVNLAPGLNVLVGANGAGKTTVLEALALVLGGTTLRPGSVRELMKRDADFLRIEVDLRAPGGSGVTATAAYTRAGDRKLTAGGTELTDASRWQEALPLRTFVPDDLRLIKGSPRRRREFLDVLAGRHDPAYPAVLKQYDEALAQRNSLLRLRWNTYNDSEFGPWERMLAQTGAAITAGRAATLRAFVGPFQQMYEGLTGDAADSIRLIYRSNVADFEGTTYEVRLAEMREADRQRTFTHLGPHRDDLRLLRRGLDMRDCASQGEQRIALLALVLTEWQQSGAAGPAGGEGYPLLLLDDVMSELDERRRRALVATLRGGGQTVITTTDLRYFSEKELEEATIVRLAAES